MIEDNEERVVDFLVEDLHKEFKKTFGDLPKKKSTEIKPRPTNQAIQLEQMVERNKNKMQVYQEAMQKMLATKEE
jgi:hypothetical protein